MKRSLKLTAFIMFASIGFYSCATIFGKSAYPVSISTNPSGATISITNKKGTEVYKGQSPATVTLKSSSGYFSKAEYQVKLSAPGYSEQVIPVMYKLNGWYFGNLFIGGVLGMLVIDPATGAMWKLDSPPINVTLNKNTSTGAVNEPTLKVIDIADVRPEMKAHLQRVK